MPRPGTQIVLRDTPAPRSAPTDTGTWFVIGMAEKGPLTPELITGMAEFEAVYGGRVTYSYLWDALDVFFREGGSRVYVGRVVGTSPVLASHDLSDGTNPTLRITAANPGDWGNSLNIAVEAGVGGGTFVLVVTHDALGELERSDDLADKTAAIQWAASSNWIRASDLSGTGDPAVVAAQSLTLGTDDHTNATDTNWEAALDTLSKDLGPGQISAPGRTTSAVHGALQAHAESRNRVAYLDGPDTASKATLLTAALNARLESSRWGGLFAPWIVYPGVVAGTTRTVPQSAMAAGITARNDANGHSANEPAAGDLGQSVFALGVSQSWVDLDREDLNTGSVNIAIVQYGGVKIYGFRTLTEPISDPKWVPLSNTREIMSVKARADVIAEHYVFAMLDGRGVTISRFGGDLKALCLGDWAAGALYGATPEEAFFVDVGPTVNTPTRINALELHAIMHLKTSPFAEWVQIEIVKRAITEGVN